LGFLRVRFFDTSGQLRLFQPTPFFCRHLGTVTGVKEGKCIGAVPFVVAKLGADWQITDPTRCCAACRNRNGANIMLMIIGVQAMTDPRYVNVMVVLTLIGFAVLAFTFLQHGSG
jgi:hypothetical protein